MENQKQKTENMYDKNADKNLTKASKNTSQKSKQLPFKKIVMLLCAVLSLSQIICMHFGLSLPLSLLIDISSMIISCGVCMGFVDYSGDTQDYQEVVKDVKTIVGENINKKQNNDLDTTK